MGTQGGVEEEAKGRNPYRDSCPDCPKKVRLIQELEEKVKLYEEKEHGKKNDILRLISSFAIALSCITLAFYFGVNAYWQYDMGACAAIVCFVGCFFGSICILAITRIAKYVDKVFD
jgi:Na+/glutamate symporter